MRISSSKQLSPGMKFFFSRIFPLIFIVIGASVAFFGLRGLIRAKASTAWPSTQGKVIESSVDKQHSSSSGSHSSSTTYHAKIIYKFTVEGTTFSGDRVAYGDYGSSNSSHARQIVNQYPKGKKVIVHYMLVNPKECLLEPGLKLQSWFLPGFGLLFLLAGSAMAIFLPKTKSKEVSEQSNRLDIE